MHGRKNTAKYDQNTSKYIIKYRYQNIALYAWGELKSPKTRPFSRVERAHVKSTYTHPQVWGGRGLRKNVRRPVLRL